MLELLFGGIIGIWVAQQFNLPSVQRAIINWWSPPPTIPQNLEESDKEQNDVPAFTGEIKNVHLPSV
jgi:hypothetical protein